MTVETCAQHSKNIQKTAGISRVSTTPLVLGVLGIGWWQGAERFKPVLSKCIITCSKYLDYMWRDVFPLLGVTGGSAKKAKNASAGVEVPNF